MTDPIPHHRAGEPLPSADWNKNADRVTLLTPVSARGRLIGRGAGIAPIEIIPPFIDISEPYYNCVADGVTDNTSALQAAFDDASTDNMAIFVPPSSSLVKSVGFLTGKINYKMVSIYGTHMGQCRLIGKPGQDVLNVDATYGACTRQEGTIRDMAIVVDDSTDNAAAFTQREGVGNAGYAIDWADRTTASPPMAINWYYDHFQITSKSQVAGGQNNSVGVYAQSNHFSQCHFSTALIGYMKYGWWDHWCTINGTSGTNSRDHTHMTFMHFIRNSYQFRMVNWGFFQLNNLMFHGGGVIGAWEMAGHTTISPGECHTGHITSVELAGATTFGLKTDSTISSILFDGVSIAGTPVDTFNGSNCEFRNLNYVPTSEPNPRLIVAGHRNVIGLKGVGTPTSDTYKYNRIQDNTGDNLIFAETHIGSSSTNPHKRTVIGPDGRMQHMRDSVSGLLGITDELFTSGNDLLINPLDILPGGTKGTSWDYFIDTATTFQWTLRAIPNNGTLQIQNHGLNGLDSFRVGKFLPATKVRVYIRLKTTTAGTQTWNLQAPSGTTKGSVTNASITTAYSTIWFDADLTGVALDTTMVINAGIVSGNGGPFDVAWIMFRPWPKDWPVLRQRLSVDNGDAAKTLVVDDLETQRWNTPLTAVRAVTLPTTNIPDGHKFHIVRTAAATGASALNVGTGPLKALALGQYADVQWDGAAWVLTAFGSL